MVKLAGKRPLDMFMSSFFIAAPFLVLGFSVLHLARRKAGTVFYLWVYNCLQGEHWHTAPSDFAVLL